MVRKLSLLLSLSLVLYVLNVRWFREVFLFWHSEFPFGEFLRTILCILMHFWARFGEVGRIWMPPQFWHIGGSMAQLHLLRCSEASKTVLHRKWSSPSLVKKNGWWVFVRHPYSRSSVSTADFWGSQMDWNRLTAILPDHLSWVPYLDLQGSTRNPRPTTSVLSVTWRIRNYRLRVATGSRTWFVNLHCLWVNLRQPRLFLGGGLAVQAIPMRGGPWLLGQIWRLSFLRLQWEWWCLWYRFVFFFGSSLFAKSNQMISWETSCWIQNFEQASRQNEYVPVASCTRLLWFPVILSASISQVPR